MTKPKIHAEEHHVTETLSALEAAEFVPYRLEIKKHGSLLTVSHGEKPNIEHLARFRRVTQDEWTLEWSTDSGRWEKTGLKRDLEAVRRTFVSDFCLARSLQNEMYDYSPDPGDWEDVLSYQREVDRRVEQILSCAEVVVSSSVKRDHGSDNLAFSWNTGYCSKPVPVEEWRGRYVLHSLAKTFTRPEKSKEEWVSKRLSIIDKYVDEIDQDESMFQEDRPAGDLRDVLLHSREEHWLRPNGIIDRANNLVFVTNKILHGYEDTSRYSTSDMYGFHPRSKKTPGEVCETEKVFDTFVHRLKESLRPVLERAYEYLPTDSDSMTEIAAQVLRQAFSELTADQCDALACLIGICLGFEKEANVEGSNVIRNALIDRVQRRRQRRRVPEQKNRRRNKRH